MESSSTNMMHSSTYIILFFFFFFWYHEIIIHALNTLQTIDNKFTNLISINLLAIGNHGTIIVIISNYNLPNKLQIYMKSSNKKDRLGKLSESDLEQ